jgi:hypothetical protein
MPCRDVWFEDGQCIRLIDITGTFSGNILRLLQNLPSMDGPFEVWGNKVRKIDIPPKLPKVSQYGDDV